MDKEVKNMYEYLQLVAKAVAEKVWAKEEDILPILQHWLNPFEPKPKDTFSPVKF